MAPFAFQGALLRTILLLFVVVTTSSCSDVLTGTEATEVRFRNETTFTLTDVSLTWPGGSMEVASLAPGATTTYERHEGAYPYGTLKVTATGTVRRIQPIDYVGAGPLSAGRYTYVIIPSTYLSDGIGMRLEIAN